MKSARHRLAWLILTLVPLGAPAAVPFVHGSDHFVGLSANGTVYAWGRNEGRLGDGTLTDRPTPVPVPGLPTIRAIRSSLAFTFAISAGDGSLYYAGVTTAGAIKRWPGITNVAGVANAWASGLAVLLDDGTVHANTNIVDPALTMFSGLPPMRAIEGVFGHTLAVGADGSVWAWGVNNWGELGNGTTNPSNLPVRVTGLDNVVAASANFGVSFALRRDGTVWAWGRNASGHLGDGTLTDRAHPVQVAGLANIVSISAGSTHAVAVREDGTVFEWGSVGSSSPFPRVREACPAIQAAAGNGATAVLCTDGSLRSFGRTNDYGQLGHGGFDVDPTATYVVRSLNLLGGTVPNATPWASFTVSTQSAGGGYTIDCDARLSSDPDGSIAKYEWSSPYPAAVTGSHAVIQVPSASPTVVSLTVTDDKGASNTLTATVLPPQAPVRPSIRRSQRGESALALGANGTLYAWGSNDNGLLGNGSLEDRAVPTRVSLVNGVTAIALSRDEALAVRADGSVWRWGFDFWSREGRITVPRRIEGINDATAVATSTFANYALRRDGTIWDLGKYNVMRQVAGLPPATQIASGSGHTVALTGDGRIWAWGDNRDGQLGQGNRLEYAEPVPVGLSDVVYVSATQNSTLAVRRDGTLWAFGIRAYAVIPLPGSGGVETESEIMPLTQVPAATDVAAAAGAWPVEEAVVLKRDGSVHALGRDGTLRQMPGLSDIVAVSEETALRSDGVVWTWGRNNRGQLGDGTFVARNTPAIVTAEDGLGSIDTNDWFLDLDPDAALPIDGEFVPRALAPSRLTSSHLSSVIRYRSDEHGKGVANFVFGMVPLSFLDLVKTAPGTLTGPKLRAKSSANLVLVQLTPNGWATVDGRLIAYSYSVAAAAGSAASILDGVPLASIPGARFCVGYGTSAQSMLDEVTLREVVAPDGGLTSVSGIPCLLSGVYVEGPPASGAGTPVTFSASVVGASPRGRVQFMDGAANLGSPSELVPRNEAVAQAMLTTSQLSPGEHAIDAKYSGDATNPAAEATRSLSHVVRAQSAGVTTTILEGPASSRVGTDTTFKAVVTGDQPTGTIRFLRGSDVIADLPLISGASLLRTRDLPAGVHQISAAYSGDGSNAGSTSTPLRHEVAIKATTEIHLASDAAIVPVGTPVTLVATVDGPVSEGQVLFEGEQGTLAVVPLVSGKATVKLSWLPPGTHVITASYAGTSDTQPSRSAAVFVRVNGEGILTTVPVGLDFGWRLAGTTTTMELKLVNGTSAPLVVSSVAASAPFVVSHDCASLAAGGVCSARVIYSPTAVEETSGTLVFTTSAGTRTVPLSGTGTASLVSHYYHSILGRAPDSGGNTFWDAEVERMATLRVDINETWYVMAGYFFNSAEYLAANKTNEQFVADLYNTFFNRPPDPGGQAYWVGQIVGGLPREVVLFSFMFSPEFRTFTQGFGSTAARPEVDMVVDFFRGLLNRLPDTASFNYWLGQLRTAQCAGAGPVYTAVDQISAAFMFNPEYDNRARNNTQFVTDMYYSFLRRGGDVGGVNYWINEITSGARFRNDVRYFGFLNSAEFGARVQAVIAAGCF